MSEYELYTRILSPRLMPNNQQVLIEKMERREHRVDIVGGKKITYSLYRYDWKEQGDLFLPFFNNTHDGVYGIAVNPAPEDLLKFCDYILLAEKSNKLYVLLLELKSGKTGDATKQLEASATFMDYIQKTAQRIAFANGYSTFNPCNIELKKIVLKPALSIRPMTNKAKSKDSIIDWKAPSISCSSATLPLYML